MKIKVFYLLLSMIIGALVFLFFSRTFVSAQDEMVIFSETDRQNDFFEAVVTEIINEKNQIPTGGLQEQLYQKLKLRVASGPTSGQSIIVENGLYPVSGLPKYQVGDKLIINFGHDPEGQPTYIITDYVRREALLWLFLIFVGVTVIVGRWHGLSSLLGMGISFLMIFKFVLPRISAGQDPILIAVLGSAVIVPVTFYLSHGINKKTSVAIVGTVLTLIITGLLAVAFVSFARLSGFATEEASFLHAVSPSVINMRGLLLAGILIGALGVFDDITVSQAAIVAQLHSAAPGIGFSKLYHRAMQVGHDHIASMVNTLVLVYAGAALPLLLLFVDSTRSFSEVINYELIADEIVRTLVASTGLVLAVPVTTFLAALVFTSQKSQ